MLTVIWFWGIFVFLVLLNRFVLYWLWNRADKSVDSDEANEKLWETTGLSAKLSAAGPTGIVTGGVGFTSTPRHGGAAILKSDKTFGAKWGNSEQEGGPT